MSIDSAINYDNFRTYSALVQIGGTSSFIILDHQKTKTYNLKRQSLTLKLLNLANSFLPNTYMRNNKMKSSLVNLLSSTKQCD